MKELTIEQKAQRYDESIEKARLVLQEKGNEPDGASILSELFPELIESEDERIRKDMIETIKKESKDFPSSVIAEKSHTWIAWLEKQGEQKPDTQHSTEWSVSDFRTWQYIVSDVLTKKDGIGQYLDSGECKKIAKYMQEEWGGKLGKEQTQEELRKGEDYGIDGLYHAISILEKTLGEVDGYQSDDGILAHKCAISAVKELSKNEWSEEDEKQARQIERIVHDDGCTQKLQKQIADWFKSLKERVKPQPKQEWSEDDDKKRKSLIKGLEDRMGFGWASDPFSREEYIDWLKSLRHQTTWEPSEEQMEALKEACDEHWEPDGLDPLYTLYQNLKKLREE